MGWFSNLFENLDDAVQNITETAGGTLEDIFTNPGGALEDFWNVTDGTLMNYDDSKGLFENIYDKWNPYLDQYSPGHQTAQDAIVDAGGFDSELEAFSTIAPMVVNYFLPGVGSYLTAADAASRGDYQNAAIGAALAYGNYSGVNQSIGNYAGLEGNAANAFGSAVTNTGAGVLSGKDLDQALINGAISGLSNYAGSSLANAGMFDSQWANNALGTVGGMATGYGLNSLFNDQGGSSFSPLTGSYYGSTPVASSLSTTDGGQTGYSTSPTTTRPMTTSSTPGAATDSATSDYGGLESYVAGDWKPQTEEQP